MLEDLYLKSSFALIYLPHCSNIYKSMFLYLGIQSLGKKWHLFTFYTNHVLINILYTNSTYDN